MTAMENPQRAETDFITALKKARAAIRFMSDQISQMRGMFNDEDGAIEESVETGDEAVDEIGTVLERYATPARIAVVLDGGMVQGVIGTGYVVGREIVVIDYDTEGGDPDEVVEVEQGDGRVADAYVSTWTVTEPGIVIPGDGRLQ